MSLRDSRGGSDPMMMRISGKSLCTRSQKSLVRRNDDDLRFRCIPALCALLFAIWGLQAHAIAGGSPVSAPERGSYCIGLHELHLPTGAKPRLSTIYAGLRDRDHGSARWGEVLASLQDRAETARTTEMPRRSRAAELYRAAGVSLVAVFSDSRLVGFDAHDGAAVIAEHTGPSATFSIEVHSVLDGRHYVFEGEGSQASRYPAV